MHKVLEREYRGDDELGRHALAGVRVAVEHARERVVVEPRVFAESVVLVEVPDDDEDCRVYWPHGESVAHGAVAGRNDGGFCGCG